MLQTDKGLCSWDVGNHDTGSWLPLQVSYSAYLMTSAAALTELHNSRLTKRPQAILNMWQATRHALLLFLRPSGSDDPGFSS